MPGGQHLKRTPGWAAECQKLVSALAARKNIFHAVAAAESLDGESCWAGAAGVAVPDGAPMRADTPFFIASVDKLLTAAAVLKLAEEGRIGLDEPMTAYLPPALSAGLHRLQGADRTDAVTVRHLLGHTSGLADWLEDRPRGGRSLVERIVEEGDRAMSVAEMLDWVRDGLTPHFPPQPAGAGRQRIRYSDTNYVLLGAIIESVEDRPQEEVFEKMLFRPLGLAHTWFAGRSRPLEPTPGPAALWAGARPLEIPLLLRSIGGIYSTAGDLIKFLRALLRGEVFGDPATLALMTERWNRFGVPLDLAALRQPGWPIEYGLGMMRFRLPRLFSSRHLAGHSGSTGTWLFHCPQLGWLFSGAVDQVEAGPVPYRFLPRLIKVLERRGLSRTGRESTVESKP